MARKKTTTAVFRVNIKVPDGANMQDCENYIREAIQQHEGLRRIAHDAKFKSTPDDFDFHHTPFLNLDASLVRVSLMERHDHFYDTGNANGNKRNLSVPHDEPKR